MFCVNCGAEVNGKFCSNCGTKVEAQSNTELTTEENKLNDINVAEMLKDNEYSKTRTITQLHRQTGLTIKECTELVEKPYRDYVSSNVKFQYSKKGNISDVCIITDTVQDEKEKELELYREKIKIEHEMNGVVKCPKCGSTSLSANKRGFGIGKAVVGFAIVPVGILAGSIGAKKVDVTCLNCGYRFKAGKK